MAPRVFAKYLDVEDSVLFGEENVLPIVAALGNVMRYARNHESRSARHARYRREAQRCCHVPFLPFQPQKGTDDIFVDAGRHRWFSFRQACSRSSTCGADLLRVQKLSALGGSVAFLDLGRDIRMVVRQPLFLLMQHLNSLLDEFIRGPIRAALHVLLDEGFQLGL